MPHLISRLLFAGAAVSFCGGGIMHAAAYRSVGAAAISRAQIPPFLGGELKVLWLADSTTLISLALVVAYIAIKPMVAARSCIMLLALLPAATAALLFLFLGPFYPGWVLAAASLMMFVGGFLMPPRLGPSTKPSVESASGHATY